MNNKIIDFLTETFLFRGLNTDNIAAMVSKLNLEITVFSRGEIVPSPSSRDSRLGFVIEGECEVLRLSDENEIVLNILTRTASFGVISVFSNGDDPNTFIRARKNSQVLYLNGNDVLSLTKSSSEVALNVIRFLTDRISFLNSRLATFSEKSVEQKLASYILSQQKKHASTCFEFNKALAAHAISAGRASLYRALEKLIEAGLVICNNKKINIIDPDGLERLLK